MFMETGTFGGTLLSDGTLSEVFRARVLIPDTEFAMLGLGDHEDPSELPACFCWCFERLGQGGIAWAPGLSDPAIAVLYFKQVPDAIAFVAHWNACRSVEPQAESAAHWMRASGFGEAYPGIFDDAADEQRGRTAGLMPPGYLDRADQGPEALAAGC